MRPICIFADVSWPALILEKRLLSIVPISVGLVVEFLALRLGGFGLGWKKAAQVDLVMNAVSAAFGVLLIPLVGILVVFSPTSKLDWPITLILAIVVSTSIEASVVQWGFQIDMSRRCIAVLALANSVSTIIAFLRF